MFINEQKKTTVSGKYDVTVCGGGIAGAAAALAAARNGANTLLIEREYALGGLATLGLIAIYLAICDGKGRQICYGIPEELIKLSVSEGSESSACAESWINGSEKKLGRYVTKYNPNVFAIQIEQLLIKNGVKILYGTHVCDTVTDNGKITHLIVENKSGRSAIGTKTVIDATGDADICNFSEENTVCYKDGNILAAWYFGTVDGNQEINPLGACDSEQKDDELDEVTSAPRISGIDSREISNMIISSHKLLLKEFLKNGKVSPTHSLSTMATIPQVRMTRRIDGIYTQSEKEMHTEYSDSVGLFPDWRHPGPVYELPFSCLRGKNIKNLLVAGRCISSTDEMWDITRVIPVCAVSGEAAGTAAAMTSDFSDVDIIKLQETLRKNGVKIHEKEL